MLAFGFLTPHGLTAHLQQLKSVALFSTLTSRELKIVDGLLHRRQYLAGEIIFDEGEEGQAVYVVLSGAVGISRNLDATKVFVADMPAGSFFGDLALLGNRPRAAQARAKEVCELAVFFRADFMRLMESDATIGYKISLQLARTMADRFFRAVSGESGAEVL